MMLLQPYKHIRDTVDDMLLKERLGVMGCLSEAVVLGCGQVSARTQEVTRRLVVVIVVAVPERGVIELGEQQGREGGRIV